MNTLKDLKTIINDHVKVCMWVVHWNKSGCGECESKRIKGRWADVIHAHRELLDNRLICISNGLDEINIYVEVR